MVQTVLTQFSNNFENEKFVKGTLCRIIKGLKTNDLLIGTLTVKNKSYFEIYKNATSAKRRFYRRKFLLLDKDMTNRIYCLCTKESSRIVKEEINILGKILKKEVELEIFETIS